MFSPRILEICVCCQALAEMLKHNSTLTNLDLSDNIIGDTGAQAWRLVRIEDSEEPVMREKVLQ